MKNILIQHLDDKSKKISQAVYKQYSDINIIRFPKTQVLLPYFLLKEIFKNKKIDALIVRYLNDNKSIFKSVLVCIADLVALLISKLFKTKIIWLCHNIDRESVVHHKKIVKLRRFLFYRFSYKILVTDPLLVKYAKKSFPARKDDIDFITFGAVKQKVTADGSLESNSSIKLTQQIHSFVSNVKAKDPDSFIGLCAGGANWKTAHFDNLIELINCGKKQGINIYMIVVGPLEKYYREVNPELLDNYKNYDEILFVNKFVKIDESKVYDYIDFVYRAYRDISVPFTVYHSMTNKKPIIAQGPGFIEEFVRENNLGSIINSEFSNISDVFHNIKKWDKKNAEIFLEKHNWDIAATKIINTILKN